MKPSGKELLSGLLGLGLAAWGALWLARHGAQAGDLEPALRLGYARPAGRLAQSWPALGAASQAGAFAPLERAFKIQASSADKLQVDDPQDVELILLEGDVMPAAAYRLFPKLDGWEIQVRPWSGPGWDLPSNSGGPVQPAAYPANGRIAYYDLGRIWISDLDGLRMQSLQHVPLLEKGGRLYWDYSGTRLCWMDGRGGAAAVELGVDFRTLKEGKAQ